MLGRLLNAVIPLENVWPVLQKIKIKLRRHSLWDINDEHWKHVPLKMCTEMF